MSDALQQFSTIAGARAHARRKLKAARIESPALTADLLVAEVLGFDRVQVLSHPEAQLTPEQCVKFDASLTRLAAGEPLQYVLGTQEFFGLSFHVTPAVLIPRPETEFLVEKALDLARTHTACRFVDVGTGSGCIAVAFLKNHGSATGWAVDCSRSALQMARANAQIHGVAHRIQFIECNLLEGFPPRPLFDLILSNPPYVPEAEAGKLPMNVRQYEPHVALFGGTTGLEIHARLIPQASARLLPGAHLIFEMGIGQSAEVTQLVREQGLELIEVIKDLQGIDRCVVARKPDRRADG